MNNPEYRATRAQLLAGGDPTAALLNDCKRTVRLLSRNAGLPAHYSPYGVWSDEAIDEVYADWVAVRLIGRGQLRAIAQRAPLLKVFRRMAETSVRQHLIDGLKPSQAANLYDRVTAILTNPRFTAAGSGAGRLWRLSEGPDTPFDGEDRELLAVAWSLGDFRVIRYDPDARKLSPLLSSDELERFVAGMLGAGAMTAATVVRALRLRFDLDEHQPAGQLEHQHARSDSDPQADVLISHLVTATLAELSERQAKILIGFEEMTGQQLATELGCSTGTISHERARIAEILARLGTDAPDVLKQVLDALFQPDR